MAYNQDGNKIQLDNILEDIQGNIDAGSFLIDIHDFLGSLRNALKIKAPTPIPIIPGLNFLDGALSITSGILHFRKATEAKSSQSTKKFFAGVEVGTGGSTLAGGALALAAIGITIVTGTAAVGLSTLSGLALCASFWGCFAKTLYDLDKARKKQAPDYLALDRLKKCEHVREKIQELEASILTEKDSQKKEAYQRKIDAYNTTRIRLLNQALALYREKFTSFSDENAGLIEIKLKKEVTEFIFDHHEDTEKNKELLSKINTTGSVSNDKESIESSLDLFNKGESNLEEGQFVDAMLKKQGEKASNLTHYAVMFGIASVGLPILVAAPALAATLPVAAIGISVSAALAGAALVGTAALIGIYSFYKKYSAEPKKIEAAIQREIAQLKMASPIEGQKENVVSEKNKPLDKFSERYLDKTKQDEIQNYTPFLNWTPTTPVIQRMFETMSDNEKTVFNTIVGFPPSIDRTLRKNCGNLTKKEFVEKFLTYEDIAPEQLNNPETSLSTIEREAIFDTYLHSNMDKNPKEYCEFVQTLTPTQLEKLIEPSMRKKAADNIVLKKLVPDEGKLRTISHEEKHNILSNLSKKDKDNIIKHYAENRFFQNPPNHEQGGQKPISSTLSP